MRSFGVVRCPRITRNAERVKAIHSVRKNQTRANKVPRCRETSKDIPGSGPPGGPRQQNQVTGAAYGQKLRYSLNDAVNDRLKRTHGCVVVAFERCSRKDFARHLSLVTVLFRFP